MALSGTKHDEFSFGQYGSIYLNGDGSKADLNGNSANRYVAAITMLEDTTFEALENMGGVTNSISTVDGEDETGTTFGAVTNLSATDESLRITTSHTFPKGVTIYGTWDFVELNSGSCIIYLAPRATPVS
tara:strand:- start:87 stop:476 length:390 start_codon:yes stop_codon:yes gene_type:complete